VSGECGRAAFGFVAADSGGYIAERFAPLIADMGFFQHGIN
jgi:hypothetical protein